MAGISRRQFVRTLVGTVAVGLYAGLLAACAPGQQPPAAQQTPKPAEAAPTPKTKGVEAIPPTPVKVEVKPGQTLIEYWHNMGVGLSLDVHMKQIQMFEEKFPQYKVNPVYVPTQAGTQLSDKLLAAVTGGNPPDAARFDRFLVTSWAARGFLEELTDYAKRDGVTEDKFIKEGWLEATWKGKVYAVPFDTDLRALYYNKKHMEEAGLDPNKPPRTIEELDMMAEKCTKKEGAKYTRLGFIPWFKQGHIYTWGWVFGGEFYDRQANRFTASHPRIVKALEWMVSYAKKYQIDAIDSFAQAFGPNENDPFIAGLVTFVSDGDWMVANNLKYRKPEEKDIWDVVPYPQGPDNAPYPVTWGGGWSTVLPKGAKQKEPGWALAKFLGTDVAHIYAIETTHIPVYLPAYDELEKNKEKFDPRWIKFWPLRSNARFRPNIPAGQEAWSELSKARDLAIHFKGEPAALLKQVDEVVNRELAKYQ